MTTAGVLANRLDTLANDYKAYVEALRETPFSNTGVRRETIEKYAQIADDLALAVKMLRGRL